MRERSARVERSLYRGAGIEIVSLEDVQDILVL